MNKLIRLLLLSAIPAILMPGINPAYAADAKAGKVKAATCSACHGPKGVSSNSEWPNLAGQNYGYLVTHITAFRDGERKNALMAPMVSRLSDQDIKDLAAYYSSLPTTQPENPAADAVGRNQVATCVACHGMLGHTVSTHWPNLAGQQSAYLANQLKAFRDGTRQNPVMSQMAAPLSDEDIKAIAQYYYNLGK